MNLNTALMLGCQKRISLQMFISIIALFAQMSHCQSLAAEVQHPWVEFRDEPSPLDIRFHSDTQGINLASTVEIGVPSLRATITPEGSYPNVVDGFYSAKLLLSSKYAIAVTLSDVVLFDPSELPALKIRGRYRPRSAIKGLSLNEDTLAVVCSGTLPGDLPYLEVIDIGELAVPVPLGRLDLVGDFLDGVQCASYGNRLYIIGQTRRTLGYQMDIVDISNRSKPQQRGSYNDLTFGTEVSGSRDRVVVAAGGHLRILDVADADNPKLLQAYALDVNRFALLGNTVLWADTSDRVVSSAINEDGTLSFVQDLGKIGQISAIQECIDGFLITTATNVVRFARNGAGVLEEAGRYTADGTKEVVGVKSGMVIRLKANNELESVDFDALPGPALRETFSSVRSATDSVAVLGTTAFVTDLSRGLEIVDIANVSLPRLVSTVPIAELAELKELRHAKCIVTNDLAFVLREAFFGELDTRALQVFDLRDLTAPRRVGGFALKGATDMQLRGKVAYVATERDGLILLDIEDPTNLRELGAVPMIAGNGHPLKVLEDRLYVLDDGLKIFDVSLMDEPRLLGHLSGIQGREIDVESTFAYIVNSDYQLVVVDVANPKLPRIASTWGDQADGGNFTLLDVSVRDGVAYLEDDNYGLLILNTSPNGAMRLIGARTPYCCGRDMAVHGNRLFWAMGSSGLQIFDVAVGLPQSIQLDLREGLPIVGRPAKIGATSSSGLPVRMDVLRGSARLNGEWLTLDAPGRILLRASQPGDGHFMPAASVFEISASPGLVVRVVARDQSGLTIGWDGAAPPFEVDKFDVVGAAVSRVIKTQERTLKLPTDGSHGFYRVRSVR